MSAKSSHFFERGEEGGKRGRGERQKPMRKRGQPGIEPGTTPTLRGYHATRPLSRWYQYGPFARFYTLVFFAIPLVTEIRPMPSAILPSPSPIEPTSLAKYSFDSLFKSHPPLQPFPSSTAPPPIHATSSQRCKPRGLHGCTAVRLACLHRRHRGRDTRDASGRQARPRHSARGRSRHASSRASPARAQRAAMRLAARC